MFNREALTPQQEAEFLKRFRSGEQIAASILSQLDATRPALCDRMIAQAAEEVSEDEAEREITRAERRAERG